jgi:adenine deaminase
MTPADAAPTAQAIEKFLFQLPKVGLHDHLYGTVRRDTFADLVRRAKAPLSDDEVSAFYTRGDKPVGVLRVLRALDQWLIRSPDDLYRITLEFLQDASSHQVRYTEFFWNPTGTARDSHIPYNSALPAIVRAIQDAQRAFGITGRLLPAIDREASPQEALEMVQWVVQNRVDEVPGIGMDYREVDRPPELFAAAYALARQHGLKTTAHAGEFGMPWHNVQTALELLKVDRIDHGYTVVDEPAFATRCAEQGVIFTVVPSNSYYLRTLAKERWALDHPIRRMHALGLRLHPNTDDPTLHHVTPTQAWLTMWRDFGLSVEALRECMFTGIDGAWVDESTRARWRLEFAAEFDALKTQLLTS